MLQKPNRKKELNYLHYLSNLPGKAQTSWLSCPPLWNIPCYRNTCVLLFCKKRKETIGSHFLPKNICLLHNHKDFDLYICKREPPIFLDVSNLWYSFTVKLKREKIKHGWWLLSIEEKVNYLMTLSCLEIFKRKTHTSTHTEETNTHRHRYTCTCAHLNVQMCIYYTYILCVYILLYLPLLSIILYILKWNYGKDGDMEKFGLFILLFTCLKKRSFPLHMWTWENIVAFKGGNIAGHSGSHL